MIDRRFAMAGAMLLVSAAPAPKAAGPQARYTMDVSTSSGFGAGMAGMGGRPSLGAMMGALRGGTGHSLSLKLWGRGAPPDARADHAPPQGLMLGASIPLVAPQLQPVERDAPDRTPVERDRPRGRILIYWGCGDHVGAGQPKVIDLATMMPGQLPPAMLAQMRGAAARAAARGRGEAVADRDPRWPNQLDSRGLAANASLVGAHRVTSAFTPAIGYSLAAGQDFMPPLGLHHSGAAPSGAMRLEWTPAAQATGYALMMFGAAERGDMILWTSAAGGVTPSMDFVAPAEVRRDIAAGRALPPATSQCLLPAEVASASPAGMVSMVGYGPWLDFADRPKLPTWTSVVRFKSSATMMLGMGGMIGGDDSDAPPGALPPRKKHRFGLGDVLTGAIPIPIPIPR